MKKERIGTVITAYLALALLVATCGTAMAGERIFEFDPASFTAGQVINNAYWPLTPGSVFVYTAESNDGCIVNELRVTGATKSDFAPPYDSIVAWTVEDREWGDEECAGNYALLEDTTDWFAQDDDGNVWYFGEDTTAWDKDECPSTTGTWIAGDEGAASGVVMPAVPIIGTWYQQELLEGVAEDRAKVLRLNAEVSIDLGTYARCLRTKEYTPLVRGDIEQKNYCPEGGGLLAIDELSGGKTLHVQFIGDTRPPGTYAATGVCSGN
jgi:hypothetical protein